MKTNNIASGLPESNHWARQISAYHESGHVVAAHWLNIRFETIEIFDNDQFGGTSTIERNGNDENYFIVVAAGHAATKMALPEAQHQWLSGRSKCDDKILDEHARRRYPASQELQEKYKDEIRQKAYELVRTTAVKNAIVQLANKLICQMKMDRAEILSVINASVAATGPPGSSA